MKRLTTAAECLEVWARAQFPGIEHKLDLSSGSRGVVDDDRAIMLWVEQTPGFSTAKDCLRHVWLDGWTDHQLIGEWWKLQGKSLLRSAANRGWGPLFFDCRPGPTWLAYRVYWRFVEALGERLKVSPPALGEDWEEPCGIEASEMAASLAEASVAMTRGLKSRTW